jgi:hypothetical protein
MQTTSARLSLSVRAASARSDINMGQLGPVLGVSYVTISNKVTGKSPWRFEEVDTLADFFGVPATALVGGPGDWLEGIDPDSVQARLADLRRQLGLDSEPTVSCVERHVTRQHAIAI